MQYASGTRAVLDVRWNSRVERDEFRIIGADGELEMTLLNKAPLVFRSDKTCTRGSWMDALKLQTKPEAELPLVWHRAQHLHEGRTGDQAARSVEVRRVADVECLGTEFQL